MGVSHNTIELESCDGLTGGGRRSRKLGSQATGRRQRPAAVSACVAWMDRRPAMHGRPVATERPVPAPSRRLKVHARERDGELLRAAVRRLRRNDDRGARGKSSAGRRNLLWGGAQKGRCRGTAVARLGS